MCMHKHARLGRCYQRKFLCSVIASEAILGQKLVEYCIQFWLFMYACAKPADFEFPQEKVQRVAVENVGWHH